ncbi:hypothetical protein, partial [Brucella pseudintermedia]|uniref:hypothetical protein n=1 Tax=Brucella pseudintermedia TaxID=370111 RepID=UPI0032097043
NTPFGFAQIASAHDCLQKAVLNQASINSSTNSSTPPKEIESNSLRIRKGKKSERSTMGYRFAYIGQSEIWKGG